MGRNDSPLDCMCFSTRDAGCYSLNCSVHITYSGKMLLSWYHNDYQVMILSDAIRLHICLLAVIMIHPLTSLKPSTRIVVSKATRSSKATTSQNPRVVFRSVLLQVGFSLVAKPSTQSVSVLRLYTKGVHMADTDRTSTIATSTRRPLGMNVAIGRHNMAALRAVDTDQLKMKELLRNNTMTHWNDD